MNNMLNSQNHVISEILSKFQNSALHNNIINQLKTNRKVFIKPSGTLLTEIVAISIQQQGFSPLIYISENEDELFFAKEELETITHKKTGLFYSFGEESSFSMDEIEERLLTLEGILASRIKFVVANLKGLSLPIPSKRKFEHDKMEFSLHKEMDFSHMAETINNIGFNRVLTVREIGETSIRGNIIDIYGFGMDFPRRIEFFGDEIISIRIFDPFTQRTIRKEDSFTLLPVTENIEKSNSYTLINYLPPSATFIFSELLFLEDSHNQIPPLKHKYQVIFSSEGLDSGIRKPPEFHSNLPLLKDYLRKLREKRVFIVSESNEDTKRCEYLLKEEFPQLMFKTLNLREGVEAEDWSLYIITDKEIFGKRFHPKTIEKSEITFKPENLSELKPDDYVVHEDYGIGIFKRMGKIEHKGQVTECLVIGYKQGDILYVPIGAMSKVNKYIGLAKDSPRLSDLSSMRWEKKKKSAKKAISDMTDELLKIYAEREVSDGFQFSPDTVWQKELEVKFPYQETEDQLRVTSEIKKDMEGEKPMDRLVCGEVGYGKTEVAVRAAVKAVMDSKQVIILAPTTILCEQHYNTFQERLDTLPVRVEMLSRFVKKSKQKRIIKDIKKGKVDIVIGTHRLLSKEIEFYDPGLLIIDEEHRFGVSQKEKIKAKRNKIDVLSMSATPIPRTLQFSLLNIRDFSTIETPPEGRLSVITRIIHWKNNLIREIILTEIERGGQVFFVHNSIKELSSLRRRIESIVPEAKVTSTHGRMKSSIIEQRMRGFLSGHFNILVTTNIIESGLDITNANTIIVNRADMFGLAQLHQLRGRVGRGNKRAYCYFVIPSKISFDARKRLSTIYTYNHLGSGLALAIKDLEIRGAGNLLGKRQHGHITRIGYTLYMKMLQDRIRSIRGEKTDKKLSPEIYSTLPAYLSGYYVQDENSRIDIYKRLSSCENFKDLEQIKEELLDRFGELPRETKNLFLLIRIKILCSGKNIKKVSLLENELELSFIKNRYPTKKSIKKLFSKVDKEFFIDYSSNYFKIRYKTKTKKILLNLKKVLKFIQ
jgi:transcription-repair coupling factor (superfamily II helicase)